MKLLITGDWQLESSPAHDHVDPATDRSVRFEENVETLQAIVTEAARAGCRGMVHLGDLTENKNPKSLEMDAAARIFDNAIGKGMAIWAIAGNHDGSLFEITSSSFEPLARMRGDKFKLFHQVTYEPTLGMLAIPYRHKAEAGQIRREIEAAYAAAKLNNQPHNIFAVAHYGVTGCAVGARNLVLAADYLTADDLLVRPLRDLFCGHVHKSQEVQLTAQLIANIVGSPYVCDHGERNDQKIVIYYDTVDGTKLVVPVPQRRRWVQVEYGTFEDKFHATWGSDDIVKVTGTYTPPDHPREKLEAFFKEGERLGDGVARPWLLELDVRPERKDREARGPEVTDEAGLRSAAQTYARDVFHRWGVKHDIVEPAMDLVLGCLLDLEGAQLATTLVPQNIEIKDFMTFAAYDGPFTQATPTLIVGRNGIGKTNFLEAALWCLTGQTSKGIDNASVVRQGAREARVTLRLDTDTGTFVVERWLKLSKAGKPTQKLDVLRDGKTIAEGGVAETQAIINRLVGGSYTVLKATLFRFQNDSNPFVRAKPADRKGVIGEIAGLEPINKAFKNLTERRQASQRELENGRSRIAGMVAAGEASLATAASTQQELEATQADLILRHAELAPLAEAAKKEEQVVATLEKDIACLENQAADLPNTAADLQAAEGVLHTYDDAFTAGREAKVRMHNNLKAQIAGMEAELKAINVPTPADIERLQTALQEAEAKVSKNLLASGIVQQDYKQAWDAVEKLEDDLVSLGLNDIGVCSRCHQKLDSSHIEAEIDRTKEELVKAKEISNAKARTAEKLGIDMAQHQEEVRAAKIALTHAQGALAKASEATGKLKAMQEQFKANTAAGLADKAAYDAKRAELLSEVKQMRELNEAGRMVRAGLEAQLQRAREGRGAARIAAAATNQALAQAQAGLQVAEERARGLEARLRDIEAAKANVEAAKLELGLLEQRAQIDAMACRILDPKEGLPVYLIDKALPFLEDRINQYLVQLGMERLSVELTTLDGDKETLAVLVNNGKEPRLDVAAFSGGQLDRIEIALKWALTDLCRQSRGVTFGMVAYDEPTGGLDEEGKQGLVNLLFEKCANGYPVVLVISHDERMIQSFDHKLRFTQGENEETKVGD